MKNYQYDMKRIIEEIKECCDRGNYYVALKEALDLAKAASIARYDDKADSFVAWCDNNLIDLLGDNFQRRIYYPDANNASEKVLTWGCVIYKLYCMVNGSEVQLVDWSAVTLLKDCQVKVYVDENLSNKLPVLTFGINPYGFKNHKVGTYYINVVRLIDYIIEATINCLEDIGYTIKPFSIKVIA